MSRRLRLATSRFDIAGEVNDLRYLIAKAEAFATIADDLFEEVGDDDRQRERLAYVVTEASVAAQAALETVNELAAELTKHGPGE